MLKDSKGNYQENWRDLSLILPKVPLRQINREELLDIRRFPKREVERSLRDIERINRYLNGTKPVEDELWRQIEARGLRTVKILDIGCGSAFLPRALVTEARNRGIEMQVIALDLNEVHLEIAREMTADFPEIEFLEASAFQVPLADNSVDFVVSTLFLHHFRPPQIIELFQEFQRIAKIGIVMGDIVRDAIPLWFFRLVRPIFAHSFLTRFDGQTSIFRAYTPREMHEIAAHLGCKVEAYFPYRMNIIWETNVGL
jgi:ubiquinone/menaquinone biosynthesis C-methylase UbiE